MSLAAERNPAIIYWGHLPWALHSARKKAMFCNKSKHGPFSLLREKRCKSGIPDNLNFEILQFVSIYWRYFLLALKGHRVARSCPVKDLPDHFRPGRFIDEKTEAYWNKMSGTSYSDTKAGLKSGFISF